MKNKDNSPYIFVIGNEKGGAGKTTCAMHLIAGLLQQNYIVASIDTDSRQHSLTSYVRNRITYNLKNPAKQVTMPLHFHVTESNEQNKGKKEAEEQASFEKTLTQAGQNADYVIIDTPGSHNFISKLAHSYANKIITPINDSFVDFDVLAKVNPDDLSIISPSIYSQMIWEQKMQRASRDRGSIEWVVMRNRLSNLDAINKRNVGHALTALAKRISFQIAPGFSERVIYRELFPLGLTLLDLPNANYEKAFNISHVAARQEIREFFVAIGINPNGTRVNMDNHLSSQA